MNPSVLSFPPRPHSPADQVERARMLATVAHGGDRNQKNGELYILHPRRVAEHATQICRAVGLSEEDAAVVVSAAWLHDTVEDTGLTLAMLGALGFPPQVLELVALLTRTRDVPQDIYYARLRRHPLARLAKLADLADNTDPARLAQLDAATCQRLCRRYAKAYRALDAEVPTHLLAA